MRSLSYVLAYIQRALATFWRKLAIRQQTESVINFIACASIFFTMRRSSANTALEHRRIFLRCHFASTPPVDCQAKSPGGAHHPLCQSSGNGLGVYILMPGQRRSCFCCLLAAQTVCDKEICPERCFQPRLHTQYFSALATGWERNLHFPPLLQSLLAQYFFFFCSIASHYKLRT
jgi:hypothetical protein